MDDGWSHRPTFPDSGDLDRSVYRRGKRVGRVYRENHPPQEGQWSWFGQWASTDNTGKAGSKREALDAVRTAYYRAVRNRAPMF